MRHKEIHQQLPDYVLGLLTPGQAQEVTQHLADCTACRRMVQGEREVAVRVRDTLNAATRPDAARLSQLIPPVPQKRSRSGISANWTTRLAPALVLLFVIVGSLLMSALDSRRPMSFFFAATATATSTNTPTATVAQESSHDISGAPVISERFTAGLDASDTAPPVQVVTAPAPLHSPTPVAAARQTATH
jgi:anti-sigma factor RsiW